MSTTSIRKKLHNYLELAEDKKIKAMYTILEDEIEEFSEEYSNELKKELDNRLENLKSGKSKSISAEDSKRRIDKIMKSTRNISTKKSL